MTDEPNNVPAFEAAAIDAMLSQSAPLVAAVRHLFVTIDPSGGKGRNYYAIASMVFVAGRCHVCPAPHRSAYASSQSARASTPSARTPAVSPAASAARSAGASARTKRATPSAGAGRVRSAT